MTTTMVTVAAFSPLSLAVTAMVVYVAAPRLPLRPQAARYTWPVWTATSQGPHRIPWPRGGRHRRPRRRDVELATRAAWLTELRAVAMRTPADARVRVRRLPRHRLAPDWRLRLAGIDAGPAWRMP